MKYTANLKLKKPEGTDVVNIDDLNDNVDILDNELAKKVDKVSGKGLSTNDYTTAEKNKLAGIETGANKYVHPSTHSATMITTSDGKNVEAKLTEVFQSGLDGKNLLETSIKSKGGTVSKQGTVATFNELDLGIKSIETDKTGDATAVAGDILSGKTAYVKGKKLTGSMTNRGSLAQTITTQGGQYNLPSGYYSGGYVKAQFPNLVASNIKEGVNIGGILGNLVPNKFSMHKISIAREASIDMRADGRWVGNTFSVNITIPNIDVKCMIFDGQLSAYCDRGDRSSCYLGYMTGGDFHSICGSTAGTANTSNDYGGLKFYMIMGLGDEILELQNKSSFGESYEFKKDIRVGNIAEYRDRRLYMEIRGWSEGWTEARGYIRGDLYIISY